MVTKKLKLLFSLIALISIIYAVYIGYEASLRIPSYDFVVAEILIENPQKSETLTDKYQAAFNLSKGVSVETSEKMLGLKLDAKEIDAINKEVRHKQLSDIGVIVLKSIFAWVCGTFLLLVVGIFLRKFLLK